MRQPFNRAAHAREIARRPEVRAKISAKMQAHCRTPEGRAAQRAKALAVQADPAKRAKWLAAVRAGHAKRVARGPDWLAGAPHMVSEYRRLRDKDFSAAEAKAMVMAMIAKAVREQSQSFGGGLRMAPNAEAPARVAPLPRAGAEGVI